MPQMFPLNWIFLFFYFFIFFAMIIINNYYMFNLFNKNTQKIINKYNKFNWKW